jgi:phage repressor protein C with HTH and peptisase S24 domain
MEPEFPDGCIVIVDPGHVASHGSFVIVEYAGDVFFRKLVIGVQDTGIGAIRCYNATYQAGCGQLFYFHRFLLVIVQ